jgi:hypothetical protein
MANLSDECVVSFGFSRIVKSSGLKSCEELRVYDRPALLSAKEGLSVKDEVTADSEARMSDKNKKKYVRSVVNARFERAPIMRCVVEEEFYYEHEDRGIILNKSFTSLTANRIIEGFMMYFRLSDVLPLMWFFAASDRIRFEHYYRKLTRTFFKWRGPDCSRDLWNFFFACHESVDRILMLRGVPAYMKKSFNDYMLGFPKEVDDVEGPKPRKISWSGKVLYAFDDLDLDFTPEVTSRVALNKNVLLDEVKGKKLKKKYLKKQRDVVREIERKLKVEVVEGPKKAISRELVIRDLLMDNLPDDMIMKVESYLSPTDIHCFYMQQRFDRFGDCNVFNKSVKSVYLDVMFSGDDAFVHVKKEFWKLAGKYGCGFLKYVRTDIIFILFSYLKDGYMLTFSKWFDMIEFICPNARLPENRSRMFRMWYENQVLFATLLGRSPYVETRTFDYKHMPDVRDFTSHKLSVANLEGPLNFIYGFGIGYQTWKNFLDPSDKSFWPKRRYRDVAFANERIQRVAMQEVKENVKWLLELMAAKFIMVEASVHFFRKGDYARAFAQLWLLSRDKTGTVGVARALMNELADYHDMKKWKDQDPELWGLEGEETLASSGVPVSTVEGPEDLWSSALWKKFATLLAALTSSAFINSVPGMFKVVFENLATFVMGMTAHSTVIEAVYGFMRTLISRMCDFIDTWDWRVFLDDGGFDTWPERVHELLQYFSGKKNDRYMTIMDLIREAEKLIDEGDKYRRADIKRAMNAKKFTGDFEKLYGLLMNKLNRARQQMNAVAYREKAPSSIVLAGPPGIGKTSVNPEILRFQLKVIEKRECDENGDPITQGSDCYTVPVHDKHWTNCIRPRMLVFNDIPGDGYINNGSLINMPDILRLAVDKEPFYTPQADIADKFACVIDPNIVVVNTNSMKWVFACFGTDWKKLVRRYRNRFYIAYPPECYKVDIMAHGSDHGELISDELEYEPWMETKLRIYSMSMVHKAGNIEFSRDKFLGFGREVLLRRIRQVMLDHTKVAEYVPPSGTERCCMDSEIRTHINYSKCCVDCDIEEIHEKHLEKIDELPEPAEDWEEKTEENLPVVSNMECWPAAEAVVDNAADGFIRRRSRQVKMKFLAMLELIKTYKVELAALAGIATLGVYCAHLALRKKETTVTEVNAVLNPVAQEFPKAFVDRFGIKEASAVEVPNPPKYPNTSRAYATISDVSKTTSFTDLVALVNHNTVQFYSTDERKFGTGVFLSPELMLVNKHTIDVFVNDGMMKIKKRADNDLKYYFTFEKFVFEGDIAIVKVPTFPAKNIIKHIANSVGSNMDIVVNNVRTKAQRVKIDFRNFLDKQVHEVLSHPVQLGYGMCGTLAVADIEGKGVIVSLHVARLGDGTSAGWIMDSAQIDRLVKALNVVPSDSLAMKVVDKVEGLYVKSKFRAAKGVSMCILGTFEKGTKQAKSELRETELVDLARRNMTIEMVIPSLQIDGVMVDGEWKAPYIHKFKGMSTEPRSYIMFELYRARRDYLDGMPVAKLNPLPFDQCVNGVVGDHLLKAMNLKTSAGIFGRFYPDKSFLYDRKVVMKEFLERLVEYTEAIRYHVIAEHLKFALKDELIEKKKELIKKYRYFMVNDNLNLFAMRCFLAPIVAHMYRNRNFFETYGAFNPASLEFGEAYLAQKAMGLLVMADVKHMDSSHRAILIDEVAEVFVEIATECGYNQDAVQVVRNLIRGIIFSVVELNGDLAFFTEGMGSGTYVTFIVNCVVLCLLYRVAWFRVSRDTFRDHNVLMTGGDDSTLGTDNPKYTGKLLFEAFADYGYELSPPTDKSGEMADFYPWEDYVFLKRSPSVLCHGGREFIVGALDQNSIWKSLGWEMPSKEISHADRMAQVLDAACREMALYGENAFDGFKKKLPSGLIYRQLTYDEIIRRYVVGELYDDLLERWTPLVESVVSLAEENQTDTECEHLLGGGVSALKEAAQCVAGVQSSKPSGPGPIDVGLNSLYKNTSSANFIGNDTRSSQGVKTATFEMASAMVNSDSTLNVEPDFGRIKNAISLQESLSRPVRILELNWTPITPLKTTLGELYALWRADTFVSSKLHGFKFFRGKPKLKIVVNGFIFYYGKLVFAVDPNPGSDGWEGSFDPKINTVQMMNLCQALQAPHIGVDPSQANTYELELPFYSAMGWYNLFDVLNTPALYLTAWVQNDLKSANDQGPDSVNIKIYFMMEDIELSVPSVAAIEGPLVIAIEGPEDQPNGTISGPLMKVAHAASVLKSVPFLTEFAGPAEVIANIGASVAAWFGFSNPIILEESRPTLNETVSPFTYVAGRAAVTKLTGDPKQSVAITAKAATVGTDNDMLISDIVKRPGLIQTTTWGLTGSMEPATVDIFPLNASEFVSAGGMHQDTPMGFISRLFRYWSGSIVVRFEIVASGIHRGTIGISWIPYLDDPGGDPVDYPNKFLTKIVDITSSKVVEFVVPFAGDAPNLKTTESNGVLRIYQVNPLKSSGSMSPIQINVYMYAGDDFELYRPYLENEFVAGSTPIPVIATEGPEISEAEANDVGTKDPLGSTVVLDVKPGREHIYFGESFTSIKQLCNRHSLALLGSYTNDPAFAKGWLKLPILFQTPCEYDNGPLPGSGAKMLAAQTYMSYLAPAFLAMRGGIRGKFAINTAGAPSTPIPANFFTEVTTIAAAPSVANGIRTHIASVDYTLQCNNMAIFSGQGSVGSNLWIHPALEFEVPYVGPSRFINPRKMLPWNRGQNSGTNLVMVLPNVYGTTVNYEYWQGAADDFSLHHFLFVPETHQFDANP